MQKEMKKMSYLDCRNILKYSNFWDDYYEKVGLFLIFLLRNHYNTIQKRICFFYINYIINLSNNDFKFAIKKLEIFIITKLNILVIENNYQHLIKYLFFQKSLFTFLNYFACLLNYLS
jgi:hypothetical protein